MSRVGGEEVDLEPVGDLMKDWRSTSGSGSGSWAVAFWAHAVVKADTASKKRGKDANRRQHLLD